MDRRVAGAPIRYMVDDKEEKNMTKYEITGDWIRPTYEDMDVLTHGLTKIPFATVLELLQKPAIRSLNFDFHSPTGEWQICSVQIVDVSSPENNITVDKDEEVVLYFRLFSIEGRTATFEYEAYLEVTLDKLRFSITTVVNSADSYESAERVTFYYFAAFAVIQSIMLHGREKVSYHKEYHKGLKPPRASRLVAPYTQPGKVHVLDIKMTPVEVFECISRETAVHTWHCPAWGVRGHYRHYKSGLISYVKPYVKGKNKAMYMGREFDLPDSKLTAEVLG